MKNWSKNLTIVFTIIIASTTANAGSVAFWHLEETGSDIYDSVNGHHGTATTDVVADTQVPGPPLTDYPPYNTHSRSFPGDENGGHIEIPDHDDLDLTGDFTLEAWIKGTGAPHHSYVITKHQNKLDNDGSWNLEFQFGEGNQGLLNFSVLSPNYPGVGINIYSDYGVFGVNEWVHVAFTYNESQDNYAYYINGDSAGSGKGNLTDEIQNTSLSLRIGGMINHSDSFTGNVDEVQIWNEYRTQFQIQQDMVAPVPEPTTLLLLGVGAFLLRKK